MHVSTACLLAAWAAAAALATEHHYNRSLAGALATGHHHTRNLAACDATFSKAVWTSDGGELLFNGLPFHLKGTSWFGFETDAILYNLLTGSTGWNQLNASPPTTTPQAAINARLDLFVAQNFNAIRLPLSADRCTAAAFGATVQFGVTTQQLLSYVLDGAAARGLIVMFDMHRVTYSSANPPTWGGPSSPVTNAWLYFLSIFGSHPALFAIDLFNEPHSTTTLKANWGLGGDNDWLVYSTSLITTIMAQRPQFNGLFFVQGTDGNGPQTPNPFTQGYFWGEYLEGAWSLPVLPDNNRVVYSPHTYGPSVYLQSWFSASDFPSNLKGIWDKKVGWVEARTGRAVVIGEWGGTNVNKDNQWMTAFVDYVYNNCLSDTFFWCVNPNSFDTGGWLTDNGALDTGKLAQISRAQSNPSGFSGDLRINYCFKAGGYSNPACIRGPAPTSSPTTAPSPQPSAAPSAAPTSRPTSSPTCAVTGALCAISSSGATTCCNSTNICTLGTSGNYRCRSSGTTPRPTATPTAQPTSLPSASPTSQPSNAPTVGPTTQPPTSPPVVTFAPSPKPSSAPNTANPTVLGAKCQARWAQCGGIGWTGTTCCMSPFVCTYGNDWYYQCL